MPKVKFPIKWYKPDSVYEYINRLIDNDENDGVDLARTVKMLSANNQLYGECKSRIKKNVTLWLISQKSHHVIYAYIEDEKIVCYLMGFRGKFEKQYLKEAEKRFDEMIS